MPTAAEEFLQQLEESHAVPPTDVAEIRSHWFRPGRKEVGDAERFRDWLRNNGYVTDFLLGALARGKAHRLTLNQYRLTDLIRTGQQAGDFLAVDPVDKVVRVQVVAPAVAQAPGWFEKFQQQAQRLINVQHPGVARTLDLGQAQGVTYLVSEHAAGESLEDVLQKRGKVGYEIAARVFAIVFDALGALHQQGVSCPDLSAQSLVFTTVEGGGGGGRTVRILNAGFPRSMFDSSALGLVDKEQLPATPARAGDGAPGNALRPEEEVYRLGVLLHRALTGQASGDAVRSGRPLPPVRQAAPDVPPMLADLIDRLTDAVPANRLKSASAVAKALRIFLKSDEEERKTREDDKLVIAAAPPPAEAQGPAAGPSERLAVDGPLFPGEPKIGRMFRAVVQHEASDLHLAVGNPPMMRLRNVIRQMDLPALTGEDLEKLVQPILSDRARSQLETAGGADFAYVLPDGGGRFRVTLFRQRGQFGLVARRVNAKVPTFEKLGLPPVMEKLCQYDQGMVILAGVTGSGKSTTLAAMIDYINEREQVHILTVEDPIEYLFTNKKAVINQREVGIDVSDWHTALKQAVRQDPDLILVGEMRDRETFEAGLNAAETGHLVFGTIHASSAPSTIGRILDLFPADMHPAMRQSLAFNLKAIVCQKLLPSIKPGVQRVPTNEVMIVNPTVRELIVRGEDKKLPDAVRIGMIEGMIDFNESLRQLVARGDVAEEVALQAAPNPDSLRMALKGIRVAQPGIL